MPSWQRGIVYREWAEFLFAVKHQSVEKHCLAVSSLDDFMRRNVFLATGWTTLRLTLVCIAGFGVLGFSRGESDSQFASKRGLGKAFWRAA